MLSDLKNNDGAESDEENENTVMSKGFKLEGIIKANYFADEDEDDPSDQKEQVEEEKKEGSEQEEAKNEDEEEDSFEVIDSMSEGNFSQANSGINA